jgi:hypothetical protein
MPISVLPTPPAVDIMTPYTAFMASQVAPRLRRRITARWKRWEPWVLIDARRHMDSAGVSVELTRLRQRHSDFLLRLLRAGVGMRVIHRHSLDDPRIADDLRALQVRAAIERQRTTGPALQPGWSDEQTWAKQFRDAALAEFLRHLDSHQVPQRVTRNVVFPQESGVTIELVRKVVMAHLKLLHGDLEMPTNRPAVVFPRQVAMYLAKQLTTASLAEIGQQFGGRHHTTVRHSIGKVQGMRRSDKNLDDAIERLAEMLRHR